MDIYEANRAENGCSDVVYFQHVVVLIYDLVLPLRRELIELTCVAASMFLMRAVRYGDVRGTCDIRLQ